MSRKIARGDVEPKLHSSAEFIKGARASGRTHPETIHEIVKLAQERYHSQD